MRTHYNPYCTTDEDEGEGVYLCGTQMPDGEMQETNKKEEVTCKKCLKALAKIDTWVEQNVKHILNDMQGFVDFMKHKK
jgi:hypothetical protein